MFSSIQEGRLLFYVDAAHLLCFLNITHRADFMVVWQRQCIGVGTAQESGVLTEHITGEMRLRHRNAEERNIQARGHIPFFGMLPL